MTRLLIFLFWIISEVQCSYAQELSAKVKINYDKLQNLPIASLYENLERELNGWLNHRRWGRDDFQANEKVDCLFSITVNEVSDRTKATLLVQSLRPVYGSNYQSPVLYIYDTQFDFDYAQHESLSFDLERFIGKNLTDVIAYYAYLVLGYDADTFSQTQVGNISWQRKKLPAMPNQKIVLLWAGVHDQVKRVEKILQITS